MFVSKCYIFYYVYIMIVDMTLYDNNYGGSTGRKLFLHHEQFFCSVITYYVC